MENKNTWKLQFKANVIASFKQLEKMQLGIDSNYYYYYYYRRDEDHTSDRKDEAGDRNKSADEDEDDDDETDTGKWRKTRPGPKSFVVAIKTKTWKKIKPHAGLTQLQQSWTDVLYEAFTKVKAFTKVAAVYWHLNISM